MSRYADVLISLLKLSKAIRKRVGLTAKAFFFLYIFFFISFFFQLFIYSNYLIVFIYIRVWFPLRNPVSNFVHHATIFSFLFMLMHIHTYIHTISTKSLKCDAARLVYKSFLTVFLACLSSLIMLSTNDC